MTIVPFEDVPAYFMASMEEGDNGDVLRQIGTSRHITYELVMTHAFQTYQANRDKWISSSHFAHNYTERALPYAVPFTYQPYNQFIPTKDERRAYTTTLWDQWADMVRTLTVGD